MNIFSRIFGSSKSMETAVSGVVRGLDALVFTDEERAELNASVGKNIVAWMSATQGQNLARRWIAVMVTGVWAFRGCVDDYLDAAWFVSAAECGCGFDRGHRQHFDGVR